MKTIINPFYLNKSIFNIIIILLSIIGIHIIITIPVGSNNNVKSIDLNDINIKKLPVTVSFYTNATDETDSTPDINACGLAPSIGDVAVSRDLIKQIPCGTKVLLIFNDGTRYNLVVHDTMGAYTINKGSDKWVNGRIKQAVDIYVGQDKKLARKLGRVDGTLYFPPNLTWRNKLLNEIGY